MPSDTNLTGSGELPIRAQGNDEGLAILDRDVRLRVRHLDRVGSRRGDALANHGDLIRFKDQAEPVGGLIVAGHTQARRWRRLQSTQADAKHLVESLIHAFAHAYA